MHELEPLPDDPREVYEAIRASLEDPRHSRLGALRRRVERAYLCYYAHRDDLSLLEPLGDQLDEDDVDALDYAYKKLANNRSPAYEAYYAKIRALSYTCAYCAARDASTLDHYLHKAGAGRFPEFAILPVNLVPSCSRCNPNGRGYVDAAGRRALIHPYFDVIPRVSLLHADVAVDARGVPAATFRVDLAACPEEHMAFARLYARHVRLLQLLDSYRDRSISDDVLPSIVHHIRTMPPGTNRMAAAAALIETARDKAARLGENHYQVALYRGAAAADALSTTASGGRDGCGTIPRSRRRSPAQRARSALHQIENEISWISATPWDEDSGASEGEVIVRLGLDAVASALKDWKGLDLPGAAPLDAVLAVLGAPDDLVEAAGRLIDLTTRSTYEALGRNGAKEAESLREELVQGLDIFLTGLEEGAGDDDHG